MKERPILFNGEMVKAILEGRKTQTRRLIKHKGMESYYRQFNEWPNSMYIQMEEIKCPYGQPGDRLWVRETFTDHWDGDSAMITLYKADMMERFQAYTLGEPDMWRKGKLSAMSKWKPSIHMPRWASRITLEIVSVRVERLQDISEEDAIKEGVTGVYPIDHFSNLWNTIHGRPGSWDKNPLVWVVEFKRIDN